jgi:hypothetical protein
MLCAAPVYIYTEILNIYHNITFYTYSNVLLLFGTVKCIYLCTSLQYEYWDVILCNQVLPEDGRHGTKHVGVSLQNNKQLMFIIYHKCTNK